jgi:hypothetical protein
MSDSMTERVEHANVRKNFVHDVTILLPMIQVCRMLLGNVCYVPGTCRACNINRNTTHVCCLTVWAEY